jgi:hypothetical protein
MHWQKMSRTDDAGETVIRTHLDGCHQIKAQERKIRQVVLGKMFGA